MGRESLVVAGGVGANRALRARLAQALAVRGARVFFPEPRFCTDNGAMIAMAAALRVADARCAYGFSVQPRWELQSVVAAR
jgi:N6-L-threonylcarbamoyladenine synthase